MARWVAGVDGCVAGWIVALRDLDAPERIELEIAPSFAAVADGSRAPSVIAVDMPIGLPARVGKGGRSAEQEVRPLLGPLGASVFPTSARDVVYAENYTAAIGLARSSGLQPFAPSPPANAIFPRIRQIDTCLRNRPELRERVYEVHPEVVFWSLNGETAVTERKKTADGFALRQALLIGAGMPPEAVSRRPPRGAAPDDWLDALAALLVAESLADGAGRPFPDPPEIDDHGLVAAIWTARSDWLRSRCPVQARAEAGSNSGVSGDIRAAARRIAPHVRRTPVWTLAAGAFGHDGPTSLKLELFQHAGSFKTRGAFNTLLSHQIPPAGVAAASGGNHGAAVAFAASRLGHKARIYVPAIASPAKIAAIRSHGAEIVIGGERYADAQDACDRSVAETGALRVHPFDADETIAGQGTVALEWEEDEPNLDTVLVAVGGGGLIAGIASWWAGRVKVVGVEPEGSRALHAALEAGRPVDVSVQSVAADSLGARNTGERVLRICREAVDHVALVADAAILEAQGRLWRDWRIASEPGGAAALAALLSGAYRPARGERVGVLLCGANVDLHRLAEAASPAGTASLAKLSA